MSDRPGNCPGSRDLFRQAGISPGHSEGLHLRHLRRPVWNRLLHLLVVKSGFESGLFVVLRPGNRSDAHPPFFSGDLLLIRHRFDVSTHRGRQTRHCLRDFSFLHPGSGNRESSEMPESRIPGSGAYFSQTTNPKQSQGIGGSWLQRKKPIEDQVFDAGGFPRFLGGKTGRGRRSTGNRCSRG